MNMIVPVSEFSKIFPGISRRADEKELAELLGSISMRNVPSGSIVLQEGEHSSTLYLVWEGALSVYMEHQQGPIKLGSIQAGQWFGEVSLLDPGPVTASVEAETDSVLLMLPEESFRMLDRQYPDITSKILRMLSAELVDRINASDELLYNIVDGPPLADDSATNWADMMYNMLFNKGVRG